jgi:fatty acid-binding protein DegV
MVSKDATQIMVQGFGGAPIETSLTHMLQRRFPNIKVQHRELGPVISIRIGAQGLSVSWRLD